MTRDTSFMFKLREQRGICHIDRGDLTMLIKYTISLIYKLRYNDQTMFINDRKGKQSEKYTRCSRLTIRVYRTVLLWEAYLSHLESFRALHHSDVTLGIFVFWIVCAGTFYFCMRNSVLSYGWFYLLRRRMLQQ